MLFINPKPLGKGVIESKKELFKDNFFKKNYGHCAVGDLALYLGNEVLESSHYLPFENIDRIYKRIEVDAGLDPMAAFVGLGTYYLVVEYDGGESKTYKFKREAAVDKLMDDCRERGGVKLGAPYEKASKFN